MEGLMKIGFIGIGVMGESIVKHLLNANYDVTVYNRTKSKADEVVALGAKWVNTPADVANAADVLFTMVGYPSDVESVYFGENGIFSVKVQDKILIDLTTSTPSLAKKIADFADENGAKALDAPVSGGDLGAKNGTLTVMVGGEKAAFESVVPIMNHFSSKIKLQGSSGAGQHTKMANQIMIAGTMIGMAELLTYAKQAQLNLEDVLDTVSAGSAQNWSLSNYGPRVLNGDLKPGFYVKHFLKDLRIALDEAKKMGITLPGVENAEKVYASLVELGYGDLGTQSLIKFYM